MFSVSAPYGPLSYLWGYFTYPTEESKKIFPVKDRFIKFLEEFGYMHLQGKSVLNYQVVLFYKLRFHVFVWEVGRNPDLVGW